MLPDIERKKEEKFKKLSTIRIHMNKLKEFTNKVQMNIIKIKQYSNFFYYESFINNIVSFMV